MAIADPVLDSAILASMNEDGDYIASFVFPPCVPEKISENPGTGDYSFTYYKVDQRNVQGARGKSLVWAPGTSPTPISVSMSDRTGTAKRYGVKVPLPNTSVDGFLDRGLDDVDRDLVIGACTQSLLIDMEQRAYAKVAALSTNGLTRSGTTLWTSDESDPLGQLKDAFDSIKKKSNLRSRRLALGKADFDALANHPSIAGLLPSDVYGVVDANALSAIISAKLYGYRVTETDNARPVIEVRIGSAAYDSAAEGLASSEAYVWGSRSILLATPEEMPNGYVDLRSPGSSRSFEAMPLTTKTYTDDDTEVVSTRVAHAQGFEFTDEGAAYYFA